MKKILSDDTPRAVAVASPVPFAGYLTYSRSQHSGYLRACPFRGAISFWRGYGKSLRVSQRAYCCGGGSVSLCHPVTQRVGRRWDEQSYGSGQYCWREG